MTALTVYVQVADINETLQALLLHEGAQPPQSVTDVGGGKLDCVSQGR